MDRRLIDQDQGRGSPVFLLAISASCALTCLTSVLVLASLWWLAEDGLPSPRPVLELDSPSVRQGRATSLNAQTTDWEGPPLLKLSRKWNRAKLSWPHDGYLSRLTDFVEPNVARCRKPANEDGQELFLVTVIHSATEHISYRRQIRETWGRIRSIRASNGQLVRLQAVFVIGLASSPVIADTVLGEMAEYGDVVQSRFADTYHNLTYKHLASLRWAWQYCPEADLILKLDDDAYLDPYAVIDWWVTSAIPRQNFLACSLFPGGGTVHRRGKWSLTSGQYPYRRFPPYCSGVGYMLSRDVAFDLLEAANRAAVPFIPIDDVYVTGLLVASLSGLQPIPLNRIYVYDADRLRRWLLTDPGLVCPTGYLIGDIGSEPDQALLAGALWIQTQSAWRNHRQDQCIHHQ